MKKEKKIRNQNPPSMVVSPRWGVAKVCETITAEVNNQNNKGVTMNYNNETPLTDLELVETFLQNTEGDVEVEDSFGSSGYYQQVKTVTLRGPFNIDWVYGIFGGEHINPFGSDEDYVPTEEGSGSLWWN